MELPDELREQILARSFVALGMHSRIPPGVVDAASSQVADTVIELLEEAIPSLFTAAAEWGMEVERSTRAYVDAHPLDEQTTAAIGRLHRARPEGG